LICRKCRVLIIDVSGTDIVDVSLEGSIHHWRVYSHGLSKNFRRWLTMTMFPKKFMQEKE